MSEWTVHLEFEEGNSSKFWRARVEGKTLYVNYGKIGANGQTQVKEFGDPGAAKAEYEKLIKEKRKKGYQDSSGGGDAEADDEADEDEDEDEEEQTAPAKKAAARPAPAKPAAAAAAPSVPGHRLVLDAGGRKVETTLYLDGSSMRMESRESYATPDAAKKAFERLKKVLAGEGYKES